MTNSLATPSPETKAANQLLERSLTKSENTIFGSNLTAQGSMLTALSNADVNQTRRHSSGLLISKFMRIWQYNDVPVRIWCGEILLNAQDMIGELPYKLRVHCQSDNKRHWHSEDGQGTVKSGDYKFITVQLPDTDVERAQLRLYVGNDSYNVPIVKLPNADGFIWKKASTCTSSKREVKLVKSTVGESPKPISSPSVSVSEIKSERKRSGSAEEDPSSVAKRKKIFRIVYPLVMECMIEVGQYARESFMKADCLEDCFPELRNVPTEVLSSTQTNEKNDFAALFAKQVIRCIANRMTLTEDTNNQKSAESATDKTTTTDASEKRTVESERSQISTPEVSTTEHTQ